MRELPTSQDKKNARAVLVGGLLVLLVGGYFIGRTLFKDTPKEEDISAALPAPAQSNPIPELDANTIRQKLMNKEQFVFVDVRGQADFESEHLLGSRSISTGALATFVPEEGRTVIIVFSAQDKNTRETTETILRQKSYPVFMLKGGIEAWKRGGNQLISAGDPNSFLDQSKVTYISLDEFKKLYFNPPTNLLLLDVQTTEAYERAHIRGAFHIPLKELEKRSGEIPAGSTIVVYGENELTSFQGGVRLADLNIFTGKTLAGSDYLKKESGLPIEP
ncbi:MAG: rhodanese-like domain-containing protein [Candidatus Moraniibacteriota bacterium]|jgi:rhodanese-related sulfurtransferase|nr:MAG: rhodanese-like domain-containing protein [Candidatus Moranbacteria bacterium]